MKTLLYGLLFCLALTDLCFAQDPLEAEVQAQQQREKEKQEVVKLQQEKEKQEQEKQEALKLQQEKELQRQDAIKDMNKRMESSAFLSKTASDKLAFRLWSGEAHKLDEYRKPLGESISLSKGKLVRVYFQRSPVDGSFIYNTLELLGEDGGLYTIAYAGCSESESKYVQAFVKFWKKEKYTRSWTDNSRTFKVDATFEGMHEGKVVLIKSNGNVIELPLVKFSLEDQAWIKSETQVSIPREVVAALQWLSNHQLSDGSWSLKNYVTRCSDNGRSCTGPGAVNADAGATAMGVLPFLVLGQVRQKPVTRGIEWLIRHQQPDGNLAKGCDQMMYSHGLATIVLCKAFGLTKNTRLLRPAQGAINFILSAQNTADGGWRYNPKDPGDTSVLGWQLTALKSAQVAGLNVGSPFAGVGKWLDSVAVHDGSEYAYQPGNPSSNTMTSVGLLGREYLGCKPDDPMISGGITYLMSHLPNNISPNVYYWYYGTQVVHNVGGVQWDQWHHRMRSILTETQVRDDSCADGSWASEKDAWGKTGGRIMTTCLSCVILEMCYGYELLSGTVALQADEITESVKNEKAQKPQASDDITKMHELDRFRLSHTSWRIKGPYFKEGVIAFEQWSVNGGPGTTGSVDQGIGSVSTVHKSYVYYPVQAALLRMKGKQVLLVDASGTQRTFNYALFQLSDQKFLDQFKRKCDEINKEEDDKPVKPEVKRESASGK